MIRDDVFWGYNKNRILDRLRLDDKVAYVTGGGQGIGRAFAHALGEAGAKVAVVDLVLAKAEAVACELNLKGKHDTALKLGQSLLKTSVYSSFKHEYEVRQGTEY